MKQLSNEELSTTIGGGWGLWAAVCCGIGIFTAGVIDGYIRPNKCK
ncbi:MAG: bacteriocin [Bacilli bacterium]